MKRLTVNIYSSFEEAQNAEDQYYLSLTPEERFEIFIQIIGHSDPQDGAIKRCITIYPITESQEG